MNIKDVKDHPDIGKTLVWEEEGKPPFVGACTAVQRATGRNWWDVQTNKKFCTVSIRFRLKPEDGSRARWSAWFPDRKHHDAAAKDGEP